MSDLFVEKEILKSTFPKNKDLRERYGTISSIVGIIVNVLLATMKILVGVFSGSIAITADALNNFSDAGSSIVSLISFKIAAKPADRDHPFGHARIEYVCSMIVSFLILVVGAQLFGESVSGFFDGEKAEPNISTLTFIILGVSIAFKLALSLFYMKMAKAIDSSVIKAAATDSLFDMISTSAVLASSIVIKYTDLWFIDSIVGLAVSVMILIAGVKILNETKNSLLGEAPVGEVVDSILAVVAEYPVVLGVHDLLVHNYGPKNYIASFHAEVDGSEDVYLLHDTIDNIERKINQDLNILCTIHMDPIVTNDETVNRLRDFIKCKVTSVCPSADIHDFRTVIGNTHTNLIFDLVVPFEIKTNIEEITTKIKAEVSKERPDCYCVITIDRA